MRSIKFLNFILSFKLTILISLSATAQLTVTFPVERMIFQRNNSNQGTIEIAGSFSEQLDRIEAKLSPVVDGQGIATDWKTIIATPEKGIFIGEIEHQSGWYKLEVRGIKNNSQLGYSSLGRVGIGEVFLVSGQSNAEGNEVYEGAEIGTTEDRINSLNIRNINLTAEASVFEFSQLGDNIKIGPYNPVPWFWARFAEKIVESENVPVLIYGCALGGSPSSWWSRSANGEDLTQEQPTFIKAAGSPYLVIGNAIKYYANRTGLRAILWQQGESDHSTTSQTYRNNLATVISKSRADIGDQISWITAIASRAQATSTNVTQGQLLMTQTISNVYVGPYTDNINDPDDRADGIHFHKDGLNKAANAWSNAVLNNNYLNTITPIMAKKLISFNLACQTDNGNKLTLNTKNSYNSYKWSTGSQDSQIEVKNQTVSLEAVNSQGITQFSPEITILEPTTIWPSIQLIGSPTVCQGESQQLISNLDSHITWNNSETSKEIKPTVSGQYYTNAANLQGCIYQSNKINITINPIPSLELKVNGDLNFCNNQSTELIAETEDENTIQWSTNETTSSILPRESGTYSVKASNEFGCTSEEDSVSLFVGLSPEKPTIEQFGPYTLKTKISADSTQINWYENNELTELTGSSIRTNTSNTYKVKVTNIYPDLVCGSEFSDEYEYTAKPVLTQIIFYPNPVKDYLYIESYEIEKADIYIYSLKGKLLYNQKSAVLSEAVEIPTQTLSSGQYILKIVSSENTISKNFIIE